jgi:cyclase
VPLSRLIPCLDVAHGRVVKGVRFQDLRDVGDPVELGSACSDAGADERVYLDVAANLDRRGAFTELVARVAERLTIRFTVGGGVRSVADAERLLRAGADKVAVNTARAPAADRSARAAARLAGGRRCDRRCRRLCPLTRRKAPTGWAAAASAREAQERGAGEILLTSVDADETRSAYDLELTRQVVASVSLPVIASGGVGEARTSLRRSV